LILVRGFLGGSAMWDAQMNAFCAWRDVICPDLAGFGDSAHLTAPESIAAHALLVLELLDSLNILTFDLLGHSMGGGWWCRK
jgi:pimeloyl-ACP methyl ester carboxylesterase